LDKRLNEVISDDENNNMGEQMQFNQYLTIYKIKTGYSNQMK